MSFLSKCHQYQENVDIIRNDQSVKRIHRIDLNKKNISINRRKI